MANTSRQNNNTNGKPQRSTNQASEDEVSELEHLRKIFVGGLTSNTDEDALRRFYEQFGKVIDVVVMRDAASKRSRGFGFVTYTKSHMVDKAQENRPHIVDGKVVDAKRVLPRSERDKLDQNSTVRKIFVGGLKNSHDEECLEEYFSQFGNVVAVKILIDKATGRRRGFAFVEFDDYDAVDKTILQSHHSLKYVLLDVKKAVITKTAGDRNNSNAKNNTTNGYQNGQSGNASYQQQQPQQQQQPMMNNGQPMNYNNGAPMNYNWPPMNYNGPPMNYNSWGPPQNYGYNQQGPPQNWNNWYPPGNAWNGPQQPSWNQGWGNNNSMPNGSQYQHPQQQGPMGPQQGPMGPQQGPMGPQQGPMGPQQGPMGTQQAPQSQQQGPQSQQNGVNGPQQGPQSHSQGSQPLRQNSSSQQQGPQDNNWNTGSSAPNNFGTGYQQNYGGGPKKNNDLSSNRMNPYNGPSSNNYGSNQQGYNGYNNSGPGQNMGPGQVAPVGGPY